MRQAKARNPGKRALSGKGGRRIGREVTGSARRKTRKQQRGASLLAERAVHEGHQEEENGSSEDKGQDNERSEGPGLCNSLRKEGGRTKNSGYIRREGSSMWVARLCGSTGRGIGRGPAGGRAPRTGLLTCLGCSGAESAVATAYKERGRSSAERGSGFGKARKGPSPPAPHRLGRLGTGIGSSGGARHHASAQGMSQSL